MGGNFGCVNATLVVLVAALTSVIVLFGDIELQASSCDRSDPNCPDRHFAVTYLEARHKFRQRAEAAGAELTVYPVYTDPASEIEYTIDAAVVKGVLEDSVIVHISGTHGVEGFVGSAIQCSQLEQLAASGMDNQPTYIFVHALNPFGMGTYRRFNHNNVDLNRNFFISDKDWEAPLARDPNLVGYDDIDDTLNPKGAPTLTKIITHFSASLYQLATKGFNKLKKSVVTGQYHNPRGVYYGGNQTEDNHKILMKIVKPFKDFKNVVVFDVHSGLGPSGVDTMLFDAQKHFDTAEKVLSKDTAMECAVCGAVSSTGAHAGYELTVGGIFLDGLFTHGTLLEVTQEFGTKPPVLVFLSVAYENAAYHAVPNSPLHERTSRWLKGSFYVQTVEWKVSTLSRGVKAIDSVTAYLQGLKA